MPLGCSLASNLSKSASTIENDTMQSIARQTSSDDISLRNNADASGAAAG